MLFCSCMSHRLTTWCQNARPSDQKAENPRQNAWPESEFEPLMAYPQTSSQLLPLSTPWAPTEPYPPLPLQAGAPLAFSLASSPSQSPRPPPYPAACQPPPPSWPSHPQATHAGPTSSTAESSGTPITVLWTSIKSPGDYQEDGPKKDKRKRPRTKSSVGRGIPKAIGVPVGESVLELELLCWFTKESLRQLFQRGSPLVLPSNVQRKWEQLVLNGGSQELNLPPSILQKASFLFLKLFGVG